MWDKRAEYLGNHDGDTVKVVLDQGFGDTKLVDIRLLGVYAPELSQPGGKECKEFVAEWFAKNNPSQSRWGVIVTTSRMKSTDREQTTLSRYVGVITSMDGSSNLNAEVVEFIHANGYGSGTGKKNA